MTFPPLPKGTEIVVSRASNFYILYELTSFVQCKFSLFFPLKIKTSTEITLSLAGIVSRPYWSETLCPTHKTQLLWMMFIGARKRQARQNLRLICKNCRTVFHCCTCYQYTSNWFSCGTPRLPLAGYLCLKWKLLKNQKAEKQLTVTTSLDTPDGDSENRIILFFKLSDTRADVFSTTDFNSSRFVQRATSDNF